MVEAALFATFQQLHPALLTFEIRDTVPSASAIPINPGALTYYRSTNELKQRRNRAANELARAASVPIARPSPARLPPGVEPSKDRLVDTANLREQQLVPAH
jgi:hypothetical protein